MDDNTYQELFSAAAWEERYSSRPDGIWSGNANPVLVDEVSDLAAGTALDVGCGEGGDALWLAARGWQVTGTDISTVALARAAAEATAQGLDVTWVHVDLLEQPPAVRAFDLVTAHFLQLPSDVRKPLYAHLAEAVAPGGTLLLVGHDFSDVTSGARPHHHQEMFFTATELAAELDPSAWEVVVAERRGRMGMMEGKEVTLHDAVLRAVRV